MKVFDIIKRTRPHISIFIATACGGFIIGVWTAAAVNTSVITTTIGLSLASLGLILSFYFRRIWTLPLMVIAAGIFGCWRANLVLFDLSGYDEFIGRNVTVRGVVSDDPDAGNSGEARLKISKIVIDNYELPGQVWASVTNAKVADVRRSDVVEISGQLRSGFGNFPASMSFAHLDHIEKIDGVDPARDVRDAFGDNLRKVIPAPASDLGMGILAGQKTALPLDISDAFRVAGLTHIVVASGYNLTILIRFARRLFAKVSRFAALMMGGGLVFAFACVTGFSPSMTRASLVAGFSLLAWYYGRRMHPIILLLTVAAITLVVNPMYAWNDAGWAMSFAAFAGVIILAPLVTAFFFGDKPCGKDGFIKRIWLRLRRRKVSDEKPHTLRQIFIETTCAQIMTAPVIALFMGQFAPYGLVSNLFVLPIVPLAMLLTFIAGIFSFVPFIAVPATTLLNYIIWVAEKVKELPGASREVEFTWTAFVLTMFAIVAVIIALRIRTKHQLKDNVVE